MSHLYPLIEHSDESFDNDAEPIQLKKGIASIQSSNSVFECKNDKILQGDEENKILSVIPTKNLKLKDQELKQDDQKNTTQKQSVKIGILLMIASGCFYALSSIGCTYIYAWYEDVDPLLIVLIQVTICQMIYTFNVGKNHKKEIIDSVERKYVAPLMYKAISGAIGGTTELVALYYIPISIVEITYNLSPIFVTLISLTCIREDVTRLDIWNVAISFAGLFLIMAYQTSEQSSINDAVLYIVYGFLIASPVLQGFGLHALRQLKGLPSNTTFYYQNLVRLFMILFYELVINSSTSESFGYLKNFDYFTWILLIGMGFSQCIAQQLKTYACKFTEASKIAGFQYIRTLLPVIYGIYVFKDQVTSMQKVGILTIIIINVTVLIFNKKQKKTTMK